MLKKIIFIQLYHKRMYKTVSGILRVFLAITAGVSFYNNCNKLQTFQSFPTMSYGAKVGTIALLVLMANFVVYMAVNGIREIKNKRIMLTAMYYIICLTYLLIAIIIIPSSHIDPQISYLSITTIITIISVLLAVYYLIADFIALFIKRKTKLQS